MEAIVFKAIESVNKSRAAYTKFITPNDVGGTGSHQSGFHIHKNAWSLFLDSPGEKGSNLDRHIKIHWQDQFETDSRFIYYGAGTRNEYRLTRFGRGFPFLSDENVGDLLILSRISEDYFEAFVLQTDQDTEDFLSSFGLSANETNRIIDKSIEPSSEKKLIECFYKFIKSLELEFPSTAELALGARVCYINSFKVSEKQILGNPDGELLQWIEAEYQLFKTIENDRYKERIKVPFSSVEELVEFANKILNRRKSRAGKSLEHHLSKMFDTFNLRYSSQQVTEENKKPDFLFPGIEEYHNPRFASNKLSFLASKTTCKDRWRQILNEADRIEEKHLFTLQQGISRNQLNEMHKYGVRLVVPESNLKSFPKEFKGKILTLGSFISYIKSKQ